MRKAAGGAKLPPAAIITLAAVLPLAHDLSEHLKFFIIIALHDQHHIFPHHEIGVLMLVGVVAHTDHAVGQIAENTTAVLAGDDRKASAAYRMALLRSKEGIGLYLLDGNDQFIFLRVIDLDDAIEHYTRVILIAQVGNCRIAYLALRKVDIMSIALCKAAPGAHRHTSAAPTASRSRRSAPTTCARLKQRS